MKHLQNTTLGTGLLLTSLMSPHVAHACSGPEVVYKWTYTDSSGYNEVNIHYPQGAAASDCPIDYYATPLRDNYNVGTVMPTIITTDGSEGGYDGVQFYYPHSADFSDMRDIAGVSIVYGRHVAFDPYSVTITANDGYQDLSNKSGDGVEPWNASDAVVTWYALGGDDRIEGGTRSVDIAYGGKGNDWYSIANVEDRAIEIDDEGFDVATIGTADKPVQNYRFDPGTSIEAIFLNPSSSVDPNYLPPNIIFLDFSVDNRGPWSTRNIADVLPDILRGTTWNDALNGNAGDSTITGEGGTDVINGGLGNDQIDGGTGDDVLIGGTGNDNVAGGEGSDLIIGGDGEGNDTYNGGPGVDTVKYTSSKADIVVNLLAKKDQARSVAGGDAAGIGVDQLSNIENVTAGYFNDQVSGNTSANLLRGEKGNDVLKGDKGKDTLIGGLGADSLYGGPDADKFAYSDIAETDPGQAGSDTIFDFDVKTEKIDLSAIDASAILDGNNAFMFKGGSAIGTSTQGEVSVVKINKPGTANDYTMIYIDNDADTAAEGVIRVKGLLTLTAKNFVL